MSFNTRNQIIGRNVSKIVWYQICCKYVCKCILLSSYLVSTEIERLLYGHYWSPFVLLECLHLDGKNVSFGDLLNNTNNNVFAEKVSVERGQDLFCDRKKTLYTIFGRDYWPRFQHRSFLILKRFHKPTSISYIFLIICHLTNRIVWNMFTDF